MVLSELFYFLDFGTDAIVKESLSLAVRFVQSPVSPASLQAHLYRMCTSLPGLQSRVWKSGWMVTEVLALQS